MDYVVDRIRFLLDEMDVENMPNQQRAEILATVTGALVTDDDRAWVHRLAATLPPMPKESSHD